MKEKLFTALTIAGSDPSGGAGIQADLKTFSAFGVFGTAALTALTAGNTTGVKGIVTIEPGFIVRQIHCVVEDIPPDAVKTGLLSEEAIIVNIARELEAINCPMVVDPVMVTKRGDILLNKTETAIYRSKLLPLATVVTPNIPEAELLAELPIHTTEDMEKAARNIYQAGCKAVVIKGGHADEWDHSNDLFFDGEDMCWFKSDRIPTEHTHGSGDVFSAAITALLAKGMDAKNAVREAKVYISKAIQNAPGLGRGQGPVGFPMAE